MTTNIGFMKRTAKLWLVVYSLGLGGVGRANTTAQAPGAPVTKSEPKVEDVTVKYFEIEAENSHLLTTLKNGEKYAVKEGYKCSLPPATDPDSIGSVGYYEFYSPFKVIEVTPEDFGRWKKIYTDAKALDAKTVSVQKEVDSIISAGQITCTPLQQIDKKIFDVILEESKMITSLSSIIKDLDSKVSSHNFECWNLKGWEGFPITRCVKNGLFAITDEQKKFSFTKHECQNPLPEEITPVYTREKIKYSVDLVKEQINKQITHIKNQLDSNKEYKIQIEKLAASIGDGKSCPLTSLPAEVNATVAQPPAKNDGLGSNSGVTGPQETPPGAPTNQTPNAGYNPNEYGTGSDSGTFGSSSSSGFPWGSLLGGAVIGGLATCLVTGCFKSKSSNSGDSNGSDSGSDSGSTGNSSSSVSITSISSGSSVTSSASSSSSVSSSSVSSSFVMFSSSSTTSSISFSSSSASSSFSSSSASSSGNSSVGSFSSGTSSVGSFTIRAMDFFGYGADSCADNEVFKNGQCVRK